MPTIFVGIGGQPRLLRNSGGKFGLDQVSEGRLILGVGFAQDVPNIRAEFAAAGVPFEKRVGRMMEGLRLCHALWSGQPVHWDSRWQVTGGVLAPTPYRAGGPPLWI